MFGIGPTEMIVIGIIAVLLFGKRVPEVARSLGKGMMEFKKGLHGMQDELSGGSSSYRSSSSSTPARSYTRESSLDDREEATAPKFEPPPTEPIANDGATQVLDMANRGNA